ncbi:MAG TPA: R3H domain-containing nucleic acid-binding protein [Thermoanaerobaculia bacterium]|nr:R3H domain-containing nucleic acid-binding protein [Thermoanaerobaculia bacterium]
MTARVSITDDLELLLEVLPHEVQRVLSARSDRESLIEVVLDLGRRPEARFGGHAEDLLERAVSADDLAHVVARVGRFGGDNRAGISGTLHRISAIRNRVGDVIGLTCRVGRAVFGTLTVLRDVIEAGRSLLLLGRPGVGKTTLLREAARVLADDLGKRVVIVDTSNEIAGDGDIPHSAIGRARRMQVPHPDQQHAVMIEAVENHMPEVVLIDEIGTTAEALAARTIAERGVQLIATAHGNTLENLLRNPTLCDLVGGIQAVTLSDDEARRRGSQKTVLERKAPPTFEVVVEIHDKDRLAVHHQVADVVDRFLRGASPRPEQRTRREDGGVEIEEAEPIEPLRAEGPRRGYRTREPGPPTEVLAPPQSPYDRGSSGPFVRKRLRIFPYGITRGKLERGVRQLGVPVQLVETPREADVVLTLKSQQRKPAKRLREAEREGLRMAVVKSNTVAQLEGFLRAEFGLPELPEDYEEALRQTEEAIDEVLEEGRPVELAPQERTVRRLQHELATSAGLTTESRGREPNRRVVIFPA